MRECVNLINPEPRMTYDGSKQPRSPPWSRRESHSGVASRSSKSRIARTAVKMSFDGLNGTAHLRR